MSDSWWYAHEGDGWGPIPVQRLRNLLLTGELDARDWLWAPGMTAWARAGTIPDFTEQLRVAGPAQRPEDAGPAPPLPALDEPRKAGPWPRLWAQLLDLYLVKAVLIVLLALLDIRVKADGTRFLVMFASLPVGLTLQALLFAWIGTTPGKALLDLRLARPDGTIPDLRTLLRRQYLLWLKGWGLGVPLVNMITFYNGKLRLDRAKPTLWDREIGADICQPRPQPGLAVLCILAILAVDLGGQVLSQ
ncbi:RDD family protein [Niveispirillum sp. KHB5.9]|uniref:RDD family protein n=1 Tax=Niveispirillum sp. KHB5.9 TaxID=3400269 RepID=UPI003A86C452